MTARLLDTIEGTVFTAGDNAYQDGTESEYRECYGPTSGDGTAHARAQLRAIASHYSGGCPYFAYFGSSAGPPGLGNYSYDLAEWHVISLNTAAPNDIPRAGQLAWLRTDLQSHPASCTAWRPGHYFARQLGTERK